MFPLWLDSYIFITPEWLNNNNKKKTKQRKMSISSNCMECLHSFLNLWSRHVPNLTVNLTCLFGGLLPFPMRFKVYAFVFQFTVHSFKLVWHVAWCQLRPQSVTCFRIILSSFLHWNFFLFPGCNWHSEEILPDKNPLSFTWRSDI